MIKFHSPEKTEESAARMEMVRRRSPPVAIVIPVTDSSCGRGGPEVGDEHGPGSMLTEAPVSTRNLTPVK